MTSRPNLTLACLAVLFPTSASLLQLVPKLMWNAGASVPIGLYSAAPTSAHNVGDLVVVKPPESLAPSLTRAAILHAACRS
jgi:type IV secretory pathway protease TraF